LRPLAEWGAGRGVSRCSVGASLLAKGACGMTPSSAQQAGALSRRAVGPHPRRSELRRRLGKDAAARPCLMAAPLRARASRGGFRFGIPASAKTAGRPGRPPCGPDPPAALGSASRAESGGRRLCRPVRRPGSKSHDCYLPSGGSALARERVLAAGCCFVGADLAAKGCSRQAPIAARSAPTRSDGTTRASVFVHFQRADAARSYARRGRTQGSDCVPREGSGMWARMPHSIQRMRSGARRSQEQGESRMTVLPGARNRMTGTKSRDLSRLSSLEQTYTV
jgi:hypothetical protein